jgi:hypothetical protein
MAPVHEVAVDGLPGHRIAETDHTNQFFSSQKFETPAQEEGFTIARNLIEQHKTAEFDSHPCRALEHVCENGVVAWMTEDGRTDHGAAVKESEPPPGGRVRPRIMMFLDEGFCFLIAGKHCDFILTNIDRFPTRTVKVSTRTPTLV